jgi:hypothetical protein
MNHLREVPLTSQMVEVHKVSAQSPQSVQVADFYQWRHSMAVAKHFQRRVAHVERLPYGALQVRVLVLQRRESCSDGTQRRPGCTSAVCGLYDSF